MLNNEDKKRVRDLCVDLVRTPSLSGQEKDVVEVLRTFMTSQGFDDVVVDEYGSIIGTIKGKRPGKTLLYDGHIDTVPVPDPSVWTHDPFGGEVTDGKIYGRGTSDMKGAVAAMACAAARFAHDTGKDFAGEICVSGVVHEECFEGVAARAISRRVNPDVVIIGEASELNLKIGQRGRAEVVLETFGVPAHSANPDKGVNAVLSMVRLIDGLSLIKPKVQPVLGAGVSVVTDIISTPYPGASVVPSHCRATCDRRLLVGETPEDVLLPYRARPRISRPRRPMPPAGKTAGPAMSLRASVFSPAGCSMKTRTLCARLWRACAGPDLSLPFPTIRSAPTAATTPVSAA